MNEYYYFPKEEELTHCRCPSCRNEFAVVKGKFETIRLTNGKDVQILFCGKCEIDTLQVADDIDQGIIRLEKIEMSEDD